MLGQSIDVTLFDPDALIDRATESGALVAIEIDARLIVLDYPFRHARSFERDHRIYGNLAPSFNR
jgi:hypothetical protein